MLNKLSKLTIAWAIAAGAFAWGPSSTTQAAFKTELDQGLEAVIRETLALPESDEVTEDEVAILTSLYITEGEAIKSLRGLEEAEFLGDIYFSGAHDKLDISSLAEIPSLQFLAIDVEALNEEGQYVVSELEKKDVAILNLSDDPIDITTHPLPIKVIVDGELVDFPEDPVIINGSTMVPFRKLFELFGLEVGWDQATRTATGTKEKLKISLTIDNKVANVSGQQITLPIAPKIIEGNTMVPLRFIGEATGRRVTWYGDYRIVSIRSTLRSHNFEYLYSNDTEYFGAEKDGIPHGQGRLLHNGKLLYEGDFKNGIIEGSGKMYDMEDRSSYYEGEFKNNRFQGNGKFVYSDGSYYTGPFEDGLQEGTGKLLNADGSLLYTGSFSGGSLHGKGTYYFGENHYYIGSFEDGLFAGQGKVYDDGKLQYEGEWAGDAKYKGKSYVDGKLDYEGYFHDNNPHGYGTTYTPDGELYYRGQFQFGHITGVGIYYFEDGSRYIGEVYYDTMDGYGFIKYDNHSFGNAGYWVNDQYYGEAEPPVTEESTMKTLTRNADYSFVDGYYYNDLDLESTEAMMFIDLAAEEHVEQFNAWSKERKAAFINDFVQRNWGDVVGADKVYAFVMYGNDVYAKATIEYEMENSAVQVTEYPKGTGRVEK